MIWFDEIDSTNTEARRRAEAGSPGPVWLAARLQNAGRGRLGRAWVSKPGNLYATLLLPVAGGIASAIRFPFAAGVAVAQLCESLLDNTQIELKWPNDIRIDRAKLGGILVESGRLANSEQTWAAIGIGLNIAHAPEAQTQATTCLEVHTQRSGLQPDFILGALRTHLGDALHLAETDFAALLEIWLTYAEGLGQTLEAGPPGRRLRGVFTGIDYDGGLLLTLPDGSEQTIRAGEIELVKQVD